MKMFTPRDNALFEILSPGGWIICLLAVLSSVAVHLMPIERNEGLEFWTFARNHKLMYDPVELAWNENHAGVDSDVHIQLLSGGALQRRLLSGFLSGTPLPALVEVYSGIAAQTFKGPLEDVGFTDLTDRLKREGLYEQINEASFGPWTSRGRIFGLPHDVHPVLLAYRADLIEAAGIAMEDIHTWEDFTRVLRPMLGDQDGDGDVDHYLLNIWQTHPELIEVLLLQAGGALFDGDEQLMMASPINARVLATVISWTTGPQRIAINAPEFDAAGNKMRLDGLVLCSLVPDWLTGVWKQDLPQLAGKVKLMPLPVWELGGRSTSVMGGSMLGIPRKGKNSEHAWAFAKHLYLEEPLAEKLYLTSGIITPVKQYWSNPLFDQPDPYFCGQAPGRLYIQQAPYVPHRTSSPYNSLAVAQIGVCAMALSTYATHHEKYTVEELIPHARELLAKAQQAVQKQIDRNVFLSKGRL